MYSKHTYFLNAFISILNMNCVIYLVIHLLLINCTVPKLIGLFVGL
jgi:hypothetical protein